MIDLRQARLLVAVYEEESLSRAAIRENSSQPAVSLLISQLEKRLKIKLFDRHARGVKATFAGKRLYLHCASILGSVHSATQEMRQLSSAVSGTLRVGMPQTICEGALVPVLIRYVTEFAAVDVRLVQAASGTLNTMLLEKQIDIAVVTPAPDLPPLRARRIYDDRMVLISGRQQGLRPMEPCDLAAIPDLKLILPSDMHGTRKLIDDFMRCGDLRVSRIIEMDGIVGTLNFVRNSDWTALLPFVAVRHNLDDRSIVINPLIGDELPMRYFLAHHASTPPSVAGQHFSDLLAGELASVAQEWQQVGAPTLQRAGTANASGKRRRVRSH